MEIGRIKEANAKETMDKLQPGDHDLSIVIAKGPSKCLHIASSLSVLAAVCQLIALCTPCWIEADARIYNNQFDKLGLLVFCFRSFTDPKRRYPQYFVSCRWFFDFEWKYMYDVMAPHFFRSVQVAFGIGFIVLLISLAELILFWLRSLPKHQTSLLFILSFSHISAAFWFFLAYTIFGARANDPDWMPGWKNNYLSWSFGVAVIGGMTLVVCSILYFVEAKRHLHRDTAKRDAQSAMARPQETHPLTAPLPTESHPDPNESDAEIRKTESVV